MKQLGDMVGVGEAAISAYELGKNEPSLDVLCAIADALDVSLDMLVRGNEKDRPEGRPVEEMLSMYDKLSPEELHLISAVINTALAKKQYAESRRQASKE